MGSRIDFYPRRTAILTYFLVLSYRLNLVSQRVCHHHSAKAAASSSPSPTIPDLVMVIECCSGYPSEMTPAVSICVSTDSQSGSTAPKTTWRPSKNGAALNRMKNYTRTYRATHSISKAWSELKREM